MVHKKGIYEKYIKRPQDFLCSLLAIIILYRITTYLILVLFNYIDFNFIYLFKSIYSSVLINIIYLIIVTLIYKKISSK